MKKYCWAQSLLLMIGVVSTPVLGQDVSLTNYISGQISEIGGSQTWSFSGTAMQARQTIAAGAIAGVMLAFRWRQWRGLREKKKRA